MIEKRFRQNSIVLAEENQKQIEVSDGVIVERRRWLWLPAMAAAAMVSGNSLAQDAAKKPETAANSLPAQAGQLEWSEFLKQSVPAAAELHRDTSAQGQEAYLHLLAMMASRLKLTTIPAAKVGRFEKLDPAVYFGPSHRGTPFFIIEWRMEPGAYLPPHCHPNASVCTVGIEGEARIRNFQLLGDAPEFTSHKPFRLRETHDEIISPGRINTLSATRDNIHTFQAGKSGARGMDISTYHGPNIGFSFLELEGKPADAEQRIFEAVWKQKN
jgi:hypothetical protein